MNKLILSGRLTDEPTMKKTQSGMDLCDFSIAVDRPGTRKENKITDFFNCTVWGSKDGPGRAGVLNQWFHKGDGITLDGVLTTRKYQDKDTGKNMTAYNVQVNDFEFPLSKKQDGGGQVNHEQPVESAAGPAAMDGAGDELPF